MDLHAPRVPTRRVFTGDDGAPLDGDRVLALALRWADRPLSLQHLAPGRTATPLEGVEVRWEENLPVFALGDGARAWVERRGAWVEPGRRAALDVGECLVVEAGGVTLEARLQRRSERLPSGSRRHENLFFGLVMTHVLMISTAAVIAMLITPRVEEEPFFGAPSLLRLAATPFLPDPKVERPKLEEQIDATLARVQASLRLEQAQPHRKASAMDTIRLLLGGGGKGVFSRGLGGGIDAALAQLHGPTGAGDGPMGGGSRDGLADGLGGGLGLDGPLGPPGPRPGGVPGGLRGHRPTVVACDTCVGKLPPGYDRELVLKVVRRHQNEIRYCYEAELTREPALAGKVTVAWTIGATGAVETAAIAESGLGNERVESCIVQRVKRWTFPEPSGGQEVAITFPWVFHVAGGDQE